MADNLNMVDVIRAGAARPALPRHIVQWYGAAWMVIDRESGEIVGKHYRLPEAHADADARNAKVAA